MGERSMALPALRRLSLQGAAAPRGREHGRRLGKEIRQMRRSFLTYLAKISGFAGALPLFGAFLVLARRCWPHIPARLQQEMRGVAAGAGVGLGTILLLNVLDDVVRNLPQCSALAVDGSHTDRSAALMGRNLDYPLFLEVLIRLQTLFWLEPEGGLPLASLAWPGYVGVCTGVNRDGVALAQLTAMTSDFSLRGVPAALRYRLALEEGKTVGQVASLILNTPGTIGNNLILCGAQEAAVLELSARFGVVRYPREGLVTATNHYQTGAMEPLRGPFPKRLPFSPLTPYHFTEAYSRAREARLEELARGRTLGPGDLQTILADAGIANPGTAVGAVFSPAEGLLWVGRHQTAPVSQGPFEEISLW